jgi:hypothetical protein
MEYQSIVFLILNAKDLGLGLRKILILIRVQRLSREGVHSSEWKKETPEMDEDIV